MKIGILTHHYVSNYGAFLQAWSLREAVSRLEGHPNVRIVNFVVARHRIINTCGCFRFDPRRENARAWLQKARLPITFQKAVRERLPRTRRVRTAGEINSLKLDALIVGSDEVWNFTDPKSVHPVKFGAGLHIPRLIAYAPSVGKSTDSARLTDEMREGLKNFTAFSARDTNTRKLMQDALGATPARVPDPTFLFKPAGEATERVKALTKSPYVLFYHMASIPETVRAALCQLARARGLRLIGAGEYDRMYDAVSVNLTPFEWCALFERAEHVITGTFHGAVFAILNGKNVSVLPNNPTRRAKLNALLDSLDMGACLLDPATATAEDLLSPRICAPHVAARVAEMREEGLIYLRRALFGGAEE